MVLDPRPSDPKWIRNTRVDADRGRAPRPGRRRTTALLCALEIVNRSRCRPELPLREVRAIARSVVQDVPALADGVAVRRLGRSRGRMRSIRSLCWSGLWRLGGATTAAPYSNRLDLARHRPACATRLSRLEREAEARRRAVSGVTASSAPRPDRRGLRDRGSSRRADVPFLAVLR